MADTILQQYDRVLTVLTSDRLRATFGAPGDPLFVEMTYDEWVDMGSPSQITVTIRPGDRLTPGVATPEFPQPCEARYDYGPKDAG